MESNLFSHPFFFPPFSPLSRPNITEEESNLNVSNKIFIGALRFRTLVKLIVSAKIIVKRDGGKKNQFRFNVSHSPLES